MTRFSQVPSSKAVQFLFVFMGCLSLVACGGVFEDEDEKDEEKNATELSQPSAIPASFANTASGEPDVSARLTTFSGSVLNQLTTDLGLNGKKAALTQSTGSVDLKLPEGLAEIAVGGDCTALFASFDGSYKNLGQSLSYFGDGDGGLASSPITKDKYTIESVPNTDSRFAFRKKATLKPTGEDDLFTLLLPREMEMAGGAGDQGVALYFNATWLMQFDEGGALSMKMKQDIFMDEPAKAITIGAHMLMESDGILMTEVATTTKLAGGDLPYLETDLTARGQASGTAKFRIEKVGDQAMRMTFKSDLAGQVANSVIEVTKTDSSCTVTAKK